MKRINALVMDAIGFSKARGDSLNIVNAPFLVPEAVEALPGIPIWEQPWVWNIGKQVLGGLVVLFLIFGVIRPAFKDMTKVPVSELPAGASAEGGAMAAIGQDSAGVQGGDAQSLGNQDLANLTTGSDQMEDQAANVRSLVQQDPALVAQVVKNWAAGDA